MADTQGRSNRPPRPAGAGLPWRLLATVVKALPAWAVLAFVALAPIVFTQVNHGECYGSGPLLLDSIAWPEVDDSDCCYDPASLPGPASPLARSLAGTVILWFLFVPVVSGAARAGGLLRRGEAVAVVGFAAALHGTLLWLGEGVSGSPFQAIGWGALQLAPLTYGLAWLVDRGLGWAEPPVLDRPATIRRRWLVGAGTALSFAATVILARVLVVP